MTTQCVLVSLMLLCLLSRMQCFTVRPRALFQSTRLLNDHAVRLASSPRIAVRPLFAASEPPLLSPNKVLFKELESQIKKDQESDKAMKKSSKFAFESNWVMALHNDMQHTVEEVAELLHKVVNCPYEHALKVTREVHFTGHGVVAVEQKPLIDMYADALVEYGLTVSTYPDEPMDEDSSGGGGGGGASLP